MQETTTRLSDLKTSRAGPNDAKMKEMILYVAQRSKTDPDFGATKLNKLLFFSDFRHYKKTGVSITGHKYAKREYGPAPSAFPIIREKLVSDNDCRIENHLRFIHTQHRLVANRAADVSVFSPFEIQTIEETISELRGLCGVEVSNLSHEIAGWDDFPPDSEIPVEIVFVSNRALSEREKEYGRQLQPTA